MAASFFDRFELDASLASALCRFGACFDDATGGVDISIEFVPAARDPEGKAHTGITRVDGSGIDGCVDCGVKLEETCAGPKTWP